MLLGLNHITLTTNDLGLSFEFYTQILGFTPKVKWQNGAYLTLGDLWFCLSVDESRPSQDYCHIAFDIAEQDFHTFATRLEEAGVKQWKQNASEGDSLYILDPCGHKLEIHCGSLATRLDSLTHKPYKGLQWFDE